MKNTLNAVSSQHIFGFATGLAVGFMLAALVTWVFDEMGTSSESTAELQLWKWWLGHGVTLMSAAIAVGGISRQIQANKELEQAKAVRALEAEVAALPLLVSKILDVAKRGIQETIGLEHFVEAELRRPGLTLDDEHIASIKAILQVAEPPLRSKLIAILHSYQVALASAKWDLRGKLAIGPSVQTSVTRNRIDLCYRWARVHALAESLLGYARGKPENDAYDFPVDRIVTAVSLAGTAPDAFPDLIDFFQRQARRDAAKPLHGLFAD